MFTHGKCEVLLEERVERSQRFHDTESCYPKRAVGKRNVNTQMALSRQCLRNDDQVECENKKPYFVLSLQTRSLLRRHSRHFLSGIHLDCFADGYPPTTAGMTISIF